MSLRRLGELIARAWPFIRPMRMHLVVFLTISAVSAIFMVAIWAVAGDLLANKVLVGERLQPLQAVVLGVGEEYITTGVEEKEPSARGSARGLPSQEEPSARGTARGLPSQEEPSARGSARGLPSHEEPMTPEQRRIVRDRLLIWFGIGGLVLLGGLASLPYYEAWIRHNINQGLRVAMVERAEHLSLKYHSQARVGDAVFRVYQDSAMIVNLLQEALIGPFTAIFWTLLALVLLYLLSPAVALACICVGVPMVWLTARFTPRIRRRARDNRLANSDLTSRLQESFAAIKVVKANRAEARILNRFHDDSRRALDAAFRLRLEIVLLTAVAMTLGGTVAIGAEYVLAGWVIEERETYRGAAVAALIGFAVWNLGAFRYAREQVEEGLGNGFWLIRIWCMAQDLFIGLERAFFLLDLEPDIVDGDDPQLFPPALASIACQNLHFSYDQQDAASLPVLRGVNLVAPAGTITAVVGASGAGKSTLMSMILRLYDPERGAVVFNDIDIRELRVDDIRANTAIALQKNVLFAGTVADNIGYAAEGKTMADVEAAAKVACAHEFIGAMEKGYRTELGERGGKLSTGQRQRLSIARAVVRDTPILILDEPTASLDAVTERELLGNLAEWGSDKVVLLITHRLSTIRDADKIAFLADGVIAETGTHEQLMARPNGRYRSFVEAETGGLEAAG